MHCLVIRMQYVRSQVGIHHEEFQDDHALMNVYTEKKILKYVSPSCRKSRACNSIGVTFRIQSILSMNMADGQMNLDLRT